MKNLREYLIVVLVAVLIILFIDRCSLKNMYQNQTEQNTLISQALNDTIEHYVNDVGLMESKINVLQTSNTDLFLDAQIKNETVKLLQAEVVKYKSRLGTGSIVRLETVTKIDTVFNTTTVVSKDTIIKNGTLYVYPEYGIGFNDSWINIQGSVNNEQTKLDIEMTNQYTVAVVKKKKWKEEYEVIVTNENPYSSTKELKAYKVTSPKPKRFGIGIQAGYGVVIGKVIVPAPYVGIGLSYNLIKF